MNAAISFLALAVISAQPAAPQATVKGNIATRVEFKGADADEVAKACLALPASCHYSRVPAVSRRSPTS